MKLKIHYWAIISGIFFDILLTLFYIILFLSFFPVSKVFYYIPYPYGFVVIHGVNAFIGILISIISGYITAKISKNYIFFHTIIVGIVVSIIAFLISSFTYNLYSQPLIIIFIQLLFIVITPLFTIFGGTLYEKQHSKKIISKL